MDLAGVMSCVYGGFPELGVPYWGRSSKGIFGGLYSGSPIFVKSHMSGFLARKPADAGRMGGEALALKARAKRTEGGKGALNAKA